MKRCLAIVIALALALPAATAAGATGTAAGTSAIEALTAAVTRLAQAMEKQEAGSVENRRLQELELAIGYLNFRSRRIESLEREISTARSNQSRQEDLIVALESRLQAIENQKAEFSRGRAAELASQVLQMKSSLQFQKAKRDREAGNLVLLENRLFELRHQIASVEDYVDRHLDL